MEWRTAGRRATTGVRILLATLGAYGLAIAVGAVSARLLPLPRVEAAVTGSLLSVPVTAAAAVAAFAMRSARVAACVIVGLAAILGTIAWIAGPPS